MNKYETQDLNLAAYLIATGACRLNSINGHDTWKKTFVMLPVPDQKTIEEFYSGRGTVGALEFCNQLRNLKSATKITGCSHEQ